MGLSCVMACNGVILGLQALKIPNYRGPILGCHRETTLDHLRMTLGERSEKPRDPQGSSPKLFLEIPPEPPSDPKHPTREYFPHALPTN